MSAYLRWSDLMNLLLHTGQMKFFSPVWVRMWRASSSDRANFLRQPSQVQGKGRSPAGDTVRYRLSRISTQYLQYLHSGHCVITVNS